jgi:hypothetical protein
MCPQTFNSWIIAERVQSKYVLKISSMCFNARRDSLIMDRSIRSKMLGWLRIVWQASTVRWLNASSVTTGAAQTQKILGDSTGKNPEFSDLVSVELGPPVPIHRPWYVLLRTSRTARLKSAGAPSCVYHNRIVHNTVLSAITQIICFRTRVVLSRYVEHAPTVCLHISVTLCIILYFSDVVHHHSFIKNRRFENWTLSPSSGKKPTQLGPVGAETVTITIDWSPLSRIFIWRRRHSSVSKTWLLIKCGRWRMPKTSDIALKHQR